MKVTPTAIADVLILEPRVFGDPRGFFFESFNQRAFNQATGLDVGFVQDNHSRSGKGVLRGLHYQVRQPQGKLVRVVRGAVWDVAVDIRRASPWFGQHVAVELSASNKKMLWIPPGFAHGFQTLENNTEFLYKVTCEYNAALERGIRCDEPALGVQWPIAAADSIRSARDIALPGLAEVENPFVYREAT